MNYMNIYDGEYVEAQRLERGLLKEYGGKSLEDVIPGEELETEKGTCYLIRGEEKMDLKTVNPRKARKKILSELKLIHGIGKTTEAKLKNMGYKTIEDLTEHPRFGHEASKFLELLDRRDIYSIIEWVSSRLQKSHPLVLYASAFHGKEDFIVLDIETLGLYAKPVILIGVAEVMDDKLVINQYFARNLEEEPALLTAFLSNLKDNSAFVTFNGRNFDVPYIEERLAYHKMNGDLNKPNFDVFLFSRRLWREMLPNCRLTTLERHVFGIERKNDVPSALVPEFYEVYLKTKNVGPLIPIIRHNKLDLIATAKLFSKLCEEIGGD